MTDREKNRFSARAARYARVGANMGGVAAKIAATRFFGLDLDRVKNAAELAAALGGLKGPIMTVAADLRQLEWIFAIHRRMDPAIDTSEIAQEIGARMREELDYVHEAKHVALYRALLTETPEVCVPRVWPALSTKRLLTLDWLE